MLDDERIYHRKAGEALHPARESLCTLATIRSTIGEYNFAGQYQQAPAPRDGGMVKRGWFKSYAPKDRPERFDLILQSWDTANKATELADYSVCTTWGLADQRTYLLHVLRKKLNSQPGLQGRRVALVAHSMGGLVSRFALEKLGIPAGLNLQLLALLATPHLGAPVAMQNVLGLRPEIFLSAKQCRDALQNPQFPSAYQLLPRPGVPALLARSPKIGFSILDPFGEDIQRQFGLMVGSLAAAKAFAADLPFMGPNFHPPCPYLAIAGNAQKTVVANYNLPEGVTPVDEENSGDGTVPLWSAAPPGLPVRYVAAAHLDVCFDSDAVGMLRAVLRPDLRGRLFGYDPAPVFFTLQPLKESVSPAETFAVAIVANKPTNSVHIKVVLTRIFGEDRADSPEEVPVDYDGGPVRSIPLEFKAPGQRAVLLFQLVNRDGQNSGEPRSVLVVS